MFKVTTVYDTIRIPPPLLSLPTKQALEMEIDQKYPNRVLLDVGLVIGRYGDSLETQHGAVVAGDAGAHCACRFQLLVFSPMMDQVCLGRITSQNASGVEVSMGFFANVFIPAYWMLNPSHYEAETNIWIWAPVYDDEDAAQQDETDTRIETDTAVSVVKMEPPLDIGKDDTHDEEAADIPEPARYEMHIGAEIRFRVKYIQYTQVTNTAKGMQSTTTSASRKRSTSIGQQSDDGEGPSSSMTLPPTMQIIASICEDGLGLTEWWRSAADEDDDDQQGLGDEGMDDDDAEDVKPNIAELATQNGL